MGKDQKIYYPRAEHAIIRYGKDTIMYAIAIPKGEARYVLNKENGEVNLVQGPKMFLPDPRKEVIVKRVLSDKVIDLLYPGNAEAKDYNKKIGNDLSTIGLSESGVVDVRKLSRSMSMYSTDNVRAEDFAADEMSRNTKFTEPRTITINSKYDGAVTVKVWTGYAVQVVDNSGDRKVVVGPKTILFEYDENPEILELSTGTPKNDDRLIKTAYLRVKNNKVSDKISATTKDLVDVELSVSYRINFVDDPNKWFNVENYIKFLTDHTRSLIRNSIKKYGIEEFNNKPIDIVRDTILGVQQAETKVRPGRKFEENGMIINDVEVLGVNIGDEHIANLLIDAQHGVVRQALDLANKEKLLELVRKTEGCNQEQAKIKAETAKVLSEIETVNVTNFQKLANLKQQYDVSKQVDLDKIADAELKRKTAELQANLDSKIKQLEAETKAFQDKWASVTPDFISAIKSLGDKELATALANNLPKAEGQLGLLLGMGGIESLKNMLKGTSVAAGFDALDRK
jgi:major vault protein